MVKRKRQKKSQISDKSLFYKKCIIISDRKIIILNCMDFSEYPSNCVELKLEVKHKLDNPKL